jgi:hypothetical protein
MAFSCHIRPADAIGKVEVFYCNLDRYIHGDYHY